MSCTDCKEKQKGRRSKMLGKQLRLRCDLSPGDVLMLTAAVRDLKSTYPNQFRVNVATTGMQIWENNPYLDALDESKTIRNINVRYPLIHQSNQRPIHFIEGYARFVSDALSAPFEIQQFRGDIHLSEYEKLIPPPVETPYWIIVAGGKHDFTAKWWNPSSYQAVVDAVPEVNWAQCGEAHHWHPPLRGVTNLIGGTNLRQFIHLMHWAEGVVCPTTFAMHLAAAVPVRNGRLRPCVVIAGGREPAHWETYPGHQYLHTIGQLPCCANGGCWKSRCQLVGDGDKKDEQNVCERPVQITDDLRIPECMTMITPERVVECVRNYRGFDKESVPDMRARVSRQPGTGGDAGAGRLLGTGAHATT